MLGRVGVVERGFNWDPGVLGVILIPGLLEHSQYTRNVLRIHTTSILATNFGMEEDEEEGRASLEDEPGERETDACPRGVCKLKGLVAP